MEVCQKEVPERITDLAAPLVLQKTPEMKEERDETTETPGGDTTVAGAEEETTETVTTETATVAAAEVTAEETKNDEMKSVQAEIAKANAATESARPANLTTSEESSTEVSASVTGTEDFRNEIEVATTPATSAATTTTPSPTTTTTTTTANTTTGQTILPAAADLEDSAINAIDFPSTTTESTPSTTTQKEEATRVREQGVTGSAETSTFASTLVSQVPSKPPTAAGKASNSATTVSSAAGERTTETPTAQEATTTTELSNVIEINFTGQSGGLDAEEVKALNNAIVEAMEDEMSTSEATVQATTAASVDVASPATSTESYDDLLGTGSSVETTTVTMDGAAVVPTVATVVGEEVKSQSGERAGTGSEGGMTEENTTVEALAPTEDAVTEPPSAPPVPGSEEVEVLRSEFTAELSNESGALVLNSSEPPEQITAMTGPASDPPGSETTVVSSSSLALKPVAAPTVTTPTPTTTTTPRTIPTTRRITGLITFASVPEEPLTTAAPTPAATEPTEAPRPGGLAPSVGIVAVKKIPTLIRVMTVQTSATVAADVQPLPSEAPAPAEEAAAPFGGVQARRGQARFEAEDPEEEEPAIQLTGLSPALFSAGLDLGGESQTEGQGN